MALSARNRSIEAVMDVGFSRRVRWADPPLSTKFSLTAKLVGVLLLVCAVTLGGIAVHVGTHPAPPRHPPERLAWAAGLAVGP